MNKTYVTITILCVRSFVFFIKYHSSVNNMAGINGEDLLNKAKIICNYLTNIRNSMLVGWCTFCFVS